MICSEDDKTAMSSSNPTNTIPDVTREENRFCKSEKYEEAIARPIDPTTQAYPLRQ